MAKSLEVAVDMINQLVNAAKEKDDIRYYSDYSKIQSLMYLAKCYLLYERDINLFEEDVFATSSGPTIFSIGLIIGKCGFEPIDHLLSPKAFGCINMPMSYFRNEAIKFVINKYGTMSTNKIVELTRNTSGYQKNLTNISDSNTKSIISAEDMKVVGKELFADDQKRDSKISADLTDERKKKEKKIGRKDTTKFLGDLLIQERFCGMGKYWASEVSLDYGTTHVRRVDFMQFCPVNQVDISGIEKGIFICYEVKSCKADFNSGFGQNFVGEKNYFVMPMSLYKELVRDLPHGVGVLVPIPKGYDKYDEFENPTPLDKRDVEWELATIKNAFQVGRQRSMNELLFCMLRAGH